MIEYLFDAIRATAGQDITINAWITDEVDAVISEGCSLMLHEPDKAMMASVEGIFNEDDFSWEFTIPASITTGLKGRYWYCIQHEGQNMCFLNPIYLV